MTPDGGMNGPRNGHQTSLALGAIQDQPPRGGGFLSAIRLDRDRVPSFDAYPFSMPVVRSLERLEFHPAVNLLIGENGSGKSTLLEALAIRLRFNPEGGSRDHRVNTLTTHSDLHQYLTLERRRHFREGWFLRAESFYNVASEIELGEREWGTGTFDHDGGRSLHERSHGEAFLALMEYRIRGGGCYLFDEPEAALSPQRQLTVLAHLHRLVLRGSQFIIATHSPILLAYPHAVIHELGGWGIRQIRYEEAEPVRVTRDFLDRRVQMLKMLMAGDS
jgi:predicted ATPase